MSVSPWHPVRDDGLNRTTLSIGSGLPTSSIGKIVQALQRVPGVLTVDADTENAQAIVAHDAAVPTASLVAAASRAGAAANVVAAATCAAAAPDENGGKLQTMQGHRFLAAVGVAAMLAVIVIDFALPNNPEKRWFFVMPVFLLWAFIVLRTTAARRP
ncbi:MAG: heavy-metal-associated domain-containing protein [Candidatus Eremiobacteraeota bacterium]|nr:heavy-metal-associated domain-containing protein [Candidatus Eremiobacteraeota bacterium]